MRILGFSEAEISDIRDVTCEGVQELRESRIEVVAWLADSALKQIEQLRDCGDEPHTRELCAVVHDEESARQVAQLAALGLSGVAGDRVLARHVVKIVTCWYLTSHGIPYPIAMFLARHAAELLDGKPTKSESISEKVISVSTIAIQQLT